MPKTNGIPGPRFYLQVTKAMREKEGWPNVQATIQAVMKYDKEVFKTQVGLSCSVAYWDTKTQRADTKKPKLATDKRELEALNNNLDEWRRLLRTIWRENYNRQPGKTHLPDLTKERFAYLVAEQTGKVKKHEGRRLTPLEFIEKYVSERIEAKDARPSTLTSLNLHKNYLLAFYQGKMQPRYDDFNATTWRSAFIDWLYSEISTSMKISKNGQTEVVDFYKRPLSDSSVNQALGTVSQFLRAAYDARETNVRPPNLKGVKIAKKVKTAFTVEELLRIREADFSNQRYPKKLENARVILFVLCFSGLRFSDYMKLDVSNHTADNPLWQDVDGVRVLRTYAQKTGGRIAIPMPPAFRELMNSVDWKLPKMAYTPFKEGLREVCRVAGIDQKLEITDTSGGQHKTRKARKSDVIATHACRRFFVRFNLSQGIEADKIRLVTGHSDNKTLMIYADMDGLYDAASLGKEMQKKTAKLMGYQVG